VWLVGVAALLWSSNGAVALFDLVGEHFVCTKTNPVGHLCAEALEQCTPFQCPTFN
jgi:hypothetical protein